MLRILRDRFLRLGRDDDGVALVTTLAVFMFMYLVCIGVYAIGTAVKTRIHLQNACDAAAYSAAVVQADTLSRIATINRAMSWTYVQMTRRQMDYIVWKWLEHTVCHYKEDASTALYWYQTPLREGRVICPDPSHSWWQLWSSKEPQPSRSSHGASNYVTLNNRNPHQLISSLKEMDRDFLNQLPSYAESFYSTVGGWDESRLAKQIDDDKSAIREMNWKEHRLALELHDRIDATATNVFYANLPIELTAVSVRVFQSEDPLRHEREDLLKEEVGYFKHLKNNAEDEHRFIAFSIPALRGEWDHDGAILRTFKLGIDRWFVRGDGSRSTEDRWDIQRSYKHWQRDILLSTWNWSAAYSRCYWVSTATGGYWVHLPPVVRTSTYGSCPHSHLNDTCSNIGGNYEAKCYGDNSSRGAPVCWEELSHIGERCEPLVLRKEYFDKNGTITVGIAVENDNPWAPIFRLVPDGWRRGIFSAFNIGTPRYTVCFASAKAGYKDLSQAPNDRSYWVSWRNERDWNLCQSDWDAVLIPVRRAEAFASDGSWDNGVTDFSHYVAENGLNLDADDMLAGGDGLDLGEHYRNRDFGEEYRFGNRNGFWGGSKPPLSYQERRGEVDAKWRIGNPNGRLVWENLHKVMFH